MTDDLISADQLSLCQNELAAAEAQIANLQEALQSARMIGAAIGIVMATYQLTYDQAFDKLARFSQNTQEKLRSLADRVVLTGVVERAHNLPR